MDITGGFVNQIVTIEPYISMDVNGKRTYGAAVSYSCREENVVRVIKNLQGENVVNTTCVFLPPFYIDASGNQQPVTVGYYDRITLTNGTKPVILKVNSQPDIDGSTAYVEVDT